MFEDSRVIELTTRDQVLNACKSKCVVLVWADYCPYCHKFAPAYKKLADAGQLGIKCYAVEKKTEAFKQISRMAPGGISSFPTTLVFCQSNLSRSTKKIEGSMSYENLLKEAVGACQPLYLMK